MSTAFTNPAGWSKHGQDLVGANEIVRAYAERRFVDYTPLSAGGNAQDKTLWLAIQNWLEASCGSFVDIGNPVNDAGTGFRFYTKATWQAAAGLNVSAVDGESFRRRINPSDADSFGHIVTGDCRGPWVFEDIQKGFSVLKWGLGNFSITGYSRTGGFGVPDTSAWSWVEANATAAYLAATSVASSSSPYAYCLLQRGDYSGDTHACNFYRNSATYTGIPPSVTMPIDSMELWAKATAYGTFDSNGDSVSESFAECLSVAVGGPASSALIGTIGPSGTSLPVPNVPSTTPPTWWPPSSVGRGYTLSYAACLIKWNFTNA